jgi:hypothetical protein
MFVFNLCSFSVTPVSDRRMQFVRFVVNVTQSQLRRHSFPLLLPDSIARTVRYACIIHCLLVDGTQIACVMCRKMAVVQKLWDAGIAESCAFRCFYVKAFFALITFYKLILCTILVPWN